MFVFFSAANVASTVVALLSSIRYECIVFNTKSTYCCVRNTKKVATLTSTVLLYNTSLFVHTQQRVDAYCVRKI